ncbi:annexin D4 [Impatiens glandulifera]|uniref:annexin D4 n=1 Tax=Impatiens glandulifera TaxID=253017 RepID=UPI001FB15C73|nr:annexin D4 [Impatiens glandulifera]
MANEIEALADALTGFGVDEKTLISSLGKWKEEDTRAFRNGTHFFSQDERLFETWNDFHVAQLRREFLRFNTAMVLRVMHPWERDARLLKDAIMDGPKSYNVIAEVACTRSSEELLGARKAFHSLFHRSLEEDVADTVNGVERKLLVALVSSYRYEGPKVKEATAKVEADILHSAFTKGVGAGKSPFEDDEVVRILSTRSKVHLKTVFGFYKKISSHNIDEDLGESCLKDAVQCLDHPPTYFVKVLEAAMEKGADENTKEAIPRVVTTRAHIDMKEIKDEYLNKHGISLHDKIGTIAKGNFRDFILALIVLAD